MFWDGVSFDGASMSAMAVRLNPQWGARRSVTNSTMIVLKTAEMALRAASPIRRFATMETTNVEGKADENGNFLKVRCWGVLESY